MSSVSAQLPNQFADISVPIGRGFDRAAAGNVKPPAEHTPHGSVRTDKAGNDGRSLHVHAVDAGPDLLDHFDFAVDANAEPVDFDEIILGFIGKIVERRTDAKRHDDE
jgi:hypothetical protein